MTDPTMTPAVSGAHRGLLVALGWASARRLPVGPAPASMGVLTSLGRGT